jgi:hypothetical protein
LKDLLGNEIVVGARIAYPSRLGDQAHIQIAEVLVVEDGRVRVRQIMNSFMDYPEGRPKRDSWIYQGAERCVVLT